ncbi:MAG: hypothetical protein WBR13_08715 [Allosphingosinicella sp.]
MLRIAALMPTRGRAACAARAVESFLQALRACSNVTLAGLCIADDSDEEHQQDMLRRHVVEVASRHSARIEITRGGVGMPTHLPYPVGGGPGAARNRALHHLRTQGWPHDRLVMFDDDVSFSPTRYGGRMLNCSGDLLLGEALCMNLRERTVVGCDYAGRQDLSILEHLRIGADRARISGAIRPAMVRENVACVAPGEISTAFLVVTACAAEVPDFVEHYNEDYLWLLGFARRGWALRRIHEPLVHAPPGDVAVSAASLSFQIFGEIVWLMVLEAHRYPRDDPAAIAAAVDEIIGDLRAANGTNLKPPLCSIVDEVLVTYERLLADLRGRRTTSLASALVAAIDVGLDHCRDDRMAATSGPDILAVTPYECTFTKP